MGKSGIPSKKGKSKAAAEKIPEHISLEQKHADDEPILPHKFPFKELISGWDTMDVHTKNPALKTGKFKKAYHGKDGKPK
jgi:hypothetical protein